MKNIKFSEIVNESLKICLIFFICLVWTRFYIASKTLYIFISVFSTIIIYALLTFVCLKKHKRASLKNSEMKKIADFSSAFIFNGESVNLNFFYELAKQKHVVEKTAHYIKILHDDGNVILYPFFMFREFSNDDLIYVFNKIKKEKPKRLVICTNKIDSSALKLAQKMCYEIVILDSSDCYFKLLVPYNHFPIVNESLNKINKTTYKDLLAISFNKKQTKRYLFTAISLLFASFFVPYSVYYVVTSSILLIFSLICLINPKFNGVTAKEIL